MIEEGWICLHRKILKWEWYQDNNTFRVFMHLLLNANWEDRRYMGMVIPRGSLVVKQNKLGEEISLSRKQILRALDNLKIGKAIDVKGYNKFTLVSIVNFNDYQDKENVRDNKGITKGTTKEQQRDNKGNSIEKQLNNITINNNTPYSRIIMSFNNICKSYPKVEKISERRKKAINARLNNYSEEEFTRVFELAEASDFMKGKNNRDWKANFDWLIKDTNMAKVLEGNYNNREQGGVLSFGNPGQNQRDWQNNKPTAEDFRRIIENRTTQS